MALSKVDLANQVENQLPQNLVANNVNFRNIIINGDMSIAQRGTSFTSDGFTLDRFDFDSTGTDGFTITQETDVPTGQGFAKSLKVDCTTANASLGTSDQIRILQKIEAQNLQYLKYGTANAQSLTLSFWVKSNKTGTYCATLSQEDNNYSAFTREYTINSASTWEKKTLTFDGDTSGVINNDNGPGFWFMFALGAGTSRYITAGTWTGSYGLATSNQVNLADNTANEWYITGVQLEAGTTASDFEFLPVDVNLTRCQRYYEKNGTTPQAYYYTVRNDGISRGLLQFIVPKRATPTVTTSNPVGSGSYTNLANPLGATEYHFDFGTSSNYSSFSNYTASAEL